MRVPEDATAGKDEDDDDFVDITTQEVEQEDGGGSCPSCGASSCRDLNFGFVSLSCRRDGTIDVIVEGCAETTGLAPSAEASVAVVLFLLLSSSCCSSGGRDVS